MRMIVAFQKTEQVRHIGHLDLLRTVQRALRRSGLPIRYSQGFNPHVLLSFASPLSVGVCGDEELLEVTLDADYDAAAFAIRLDQAMPDSLPVIAARAVPDTHPKLMAALCTAEYAATFNKNTQMDQNGHIGVNAQMDTMAFAVAAMASEVATMLSRKEIIAIRKTKSGEKPCDIRPMLHALNVAYKDTQTVFTFRTSLTEKETLKADLLLQTLAEQANVVLPPYRLCRLRLFAERDQQAVSLLAY